MSLGNMRSRIADELHRSDLTTEIERQIRTAIEHYESTRFRWNEVRGWDVATTVAGTQNYSLTSDFIRFDVLKINYNGHYILLTPRTWQWMEERDTQVTPVRGAPSNYVVYGGSADNELRLFPTPDGAHSLVASYVQRLSSLTASADTNDWMTYGEELIRHRARAAVEIFRLQKPRAIAEFNAMAQGRRFFLSAAEEVAHKSLIDERNDALTTGSLKPYAI